MIVLTIIALTISDNLNKAFRLRSSGSRCAARSTAMVMHAFRQASLGRVNRIGDTQPTDNQLADFQPPDLGAPDHETTNRHCTECQRARSNGARRDRSNGMGAYLNRANPQGSSLFLGRV